MYYLYVFSSRNESTAFYNYLKRNGVVAHLVATPKECMTGCGLSVRVESSQFNISNRLFNSYNYRYTWRGIFRCEKMGIGNNIERIR